MSRFLGPVALAALAAFAACTGEDPPVLVINAPDAGASSSGVSSSSGGTSSSGLVEGGVDNECPSGQTMCGTQCEDLQTSPTSCSACGFSCGAGDCVAGACKPAVLVRELSSVFGLAVSSAGVAFGTATSIQLCANEKGCAASEVKTLISVLTTPTPFTLTSSALVFFNERSQGEHDLSSCPAPAGCAGGPVVLEPGLNARIGGITLGANDRLAWSRKAEHGSYLSSCALPGCVSIGLLRKPYASPPPNTEVDNPSKILSVGEKTVFWGTGGLVSLSGYDIRGCALDKAGDCTELVEPPNTDGENVVALRYFNGRHYILKDGASGTKVYFLVDAAPGSLVPIATGAAGGTDLAVDAAGVYWVNAITKEILRAELGDEVSGAKPGIVLADGQAGARFIATDERFVYWSLPDEIMQLRKEPEKK